MLQDKEIPFEERWELYVLLDCQGLPDAAALPKCTDLFLPLVHEVLQKYNYNWQEYAERYSSVNLIDFINDIEEAIPDNDAHTGKRFVRELKEAAVECGYGSFIYDW